MYQLSRPVVLAEMKHCLLVLGEILIFQSLERMCFWGE